jgi:inward rectifier potassium channel
MDVPTFDPGLTQQYTATLRRAIDKNGNFNVRRKGMNWHDIHPYLFMVGASWPTFLGFISLAYVSSNIIFAVIYFAIGTEHLRGIDATTPGGRFLQAFFFSAHTFTTVGYGSISPVGTAANSVAAFEALVGLLALALATGLLFGRFSRPAARIAFSKSALIAPYLGGSSLQFRIANRRTNNLMELEAKILLMTVETVNGRLQRKYTALTLERPAVLFLPLTWTVVHPIDDTSPLLGKTAADLERLQAEFLILIKGYDDMASQTTHTRYSYRHDELVWGARFSPAFSIDESGDLVLEIDRLSDFKPDQLVLANN